MSENNITINSEYSAQGRNHSTNPGLKRFLEKSDLIIEGKKFENVVDLGCGKLRHLDVLCGLSKNLYCVDKKEQIERAHTEDGKRIELEDILKRCSATNSISLLDVHEFEKMKLNADLIINIAVADVIPQMDFLKLVELAHKKLGEEGAFVTIIPRNDSSIIKNFKEENSYKGGYLIKRGRIM